jgi:hypothetical protein
LLLVLASAVILRSESRGTHYHILVSQIRDSPNLEGQVPVCQYTYEIRINVAFDTVTDLYKTNNINAPTYLGTTLREVLEKTTDFKGVITYSSF